MSMFRRCYGLAQASMHIDEMFDARMAWFVDAPLILASPLSGAGPVRHRLDRFGPCPCAFLIGADDFDAAADQFRLIEPNTWFERRIAWFEPGESGRVELGVTS